MCFNLVSISILSLLDVAEIKYEIKQSGRYVRLKLVGDENQLYGFCYASIYDSLKSSLKASKLDSNEIEFQLIDSGEDIRKELDQRFKMEKVYLPKVILRKYSDTKRHVYHLNEFQLN